MPKPIRLVDPFITLGGPTTPPPVDFTCFCAGIHLTGEVDDDLATFCDPEGFAWQLALDLKMSLGTGSLDEALMSLGGPGTVVAFEFAYTKDPAATDNPHWTGEIRIPPYPIVDAGINEPTSFTMTCDIIGDITRMPAPTGFAVSGLTPEHKADEVGAETAGAAA